MLLIKHATEIVHYIDGGNCNESAPLYHHFKAHRGVHIFLGKNQLQRKRPSKSKMKMDVEKKPTITVWNYECTIPTSPFTCNVFAGHVYYNQGFTHSPLRDKEQELFTSSRILILQFAPDSVQFDIISCMTIKLFNCLIFNPGLLNDIDNP